MYYFIQFSKEKEKKLDIVYEVDIILFCYLYFFKEIAVSDDFQFFKNEVDFIFDEECFIFF